MPLDTSHGRVLATSGTDDNVTYPDEDHFDDPDGNDASISLLNYKSTRRQGDLDSPRHTRFDAARLYGRLRSSRIGRCTFRLPVVAAILWIGLFVSVSLYWFEADLSAGIGILRTTLPAYDGPIVDISESERLQYVENLIVLNRTMRERWPHHPDWYPARTTTLESIEHLIDCLGSNTCTAAESNVIIGGSMHFGNGLHGGVSGEDIWARSSVDAFQELGHTVLFSWQLLEGLDLYQAMPKLVRLVIFEGSTVDDCVNYGLPQMVRPHQIHSGEAREASDEELYRWGIEDSRVNDDTVWAFKLHEGQLNPERGGCVRKKGYEHGIPVWKMFAFHFWDGPNHVLGRDWTLSPEDYVKHPCHGEEPSNYFLGYSVEKYCAMYADPPEHRQRRAYILAKSVEYFDRKDYPWDSNNGTLWTNVTKEVDVEFVAGAGGKGDFIRNDITNLGRLREGTFYQEVAQGRLVIGIGAPPLSPTPYDALCLGVPFLNPLRQWKEDDPDNPAFWCGQQDGLLSIGPPYVYHVRQHDMTGFKNAVASAMNVTIEPYTPLHMTHDANLERHKTLVQRDWEVEGVLAVEKVHERDWYSDLY